MFTGIYLQVKLSEPLEKMLHAFAAIPNVASFLKDKALNPGAK